MLTDLLDRAQPAFDEWQRAVVFEPKLHKHKADAGDAVKAEVTERQEALCAAVRAGPTSLGPYLRGQLSIGVQEEIAAPPFPRQQLTPGEYLNPPVPLEQEIGGAWRDAPSPSLASQPLFWLLCHIEWIEEGRFGGGNLSRVFLDRTASVLVDSAGRVDHEARTRNLLRRTGGIPHVRGKVSVFANCTVARAWWRHRLALEAARCLPDLSVQVAHRALHANGPAWERLVQLSVRRLTVINQPRARAAIVQAMAKRLDETGAVHRDEVQGMAVRLAQLGLRSSLDHVSDAVLASAVAGTQEAR